MLKIFCTSCGGEGYKSVHMIDFTCNACGKTIKAGEPAVLKRFCDRCGKEIPEGDTLGDIAFFVKDNDFEDDDEEEPLRLYLDFCGKCMEELEKQIMKEARYAVHDV